jgi:hypothetical protein
MLASRTGTRLSSVRPDKLCSQSYLNAQIQLWRHTNGQCTCYYWGGRAATALEAGGWDQRREPSAMPPLSRRGVGVGGGGAGCSGGRRGPAATVQHPRAQQTCQRAIAEKMY